MKLTALVVAVVAFSTTEAFSQCDVVRDVAKTQLNQYLERIKERVSGDADEMFHSEYVQNSLRPDANNGRPYQVERGTRNWMLRRTCYL